MITQIQKRVLILAVRAAEIMMKSGAEIYRVEDTIMRICRACKIPYVEVFATPTGVFVTIGSGGENGDVETYVKRIHGFDTDLTKISKINDFSRVFTNTDLSVEDGMKQLQAIDQGALYPLPVRLLGAALISAFFCSIYSGGILDSLCALVTGVAAYSLSYLLSKYEINLFMKGMCCCALTTAIALAATTLGLPIDFSSIAIGSLMLFVPGVPITNSIRDFLSGDMLSGLARLMEAVLIAVSLAAGAGIVIKIWAIISKEDIGVPSIHLGTTAVMLAVFLGFMPTFGFCLLFHVPKRHLVASALVGALGWAAFELSSSFGHNNIMACFLGACLVGLLSDIFARKFKEAATVFIIPGILPLVPGSNIYYTMMELMNGTLTAAVHQGLTTLFMAGAIALGLLVMGSVVRIFISIKRNVTSRL